MPMCECGCGEVARKRFIVGHNIRGANAPWWKGGYAWSAGYRTRLVPGHERATCRGYVLEHVLIAQRALGKPLPAGAMVHHVNAVRHDNRNSNLVICEGNAYHMLLHRRMKAYAAGVDPSWRRCHYCGKHDDPSLLYIPPANGGPYHRTCRKTGDRIRACKARAARGNNISREAQRAEKDGRVQTQTGVAHADRVGCPSALGELRNTVYRELVPVGGMSGMFPRDLP